MTAPADPPDIARSEYVHHCAAIGNAARNAHEALQRNDTSDAIWWLDQAHHWVEMAKAVAPECRPLDAETVARIIAERNGASA